MMGKRWALAGAALLFIALLPGCTATMQDVIEAENQGTAVVYPVTLNEAWDISRSVLHWEGADLIESHREEGYMLSTVPQSFWSTGGLVGVWIDSVTQHHTKVTIVVKKRHPQTIGGPPFTESDFQKKFAEAVEIVSSGKPLPLEAPK